MYFPYAKDIWRFIGFGATPTGASMANVFMQNWLILGKERAAL